MRVTAMAALLLVATALRAQQPTPTPAGDEGGSGMASGGSAAGPAHAAVLDAQHRPITAGGFVDSGPIYFQNIAAQAGLTSWQHVSGPPQKRYILDSIGSGVTLLDYDNDGWLDIYLVNGSTYDALSGHTSPLHAALFHNNHDGTFTDVTAKAGVGNDRWGFGATVADYDNDGWPDIYVSNYGANRLYRNNHDGTFTDVAVQAGVSLTPAAGQLPVWSTGATWGDFDGDGRLDLFVPGYLRFDAAHPPEQGSREVAYRFCRFRGVQVMCGPRGLPGAPDHLFRNNGDGTFTDVSVTAGVADKPGYYGLASLFLSLSGHAPPDLLVANDSTPNYLYLNQGHGTFADHSYDSGYALNDAGNETASMGIAFGDLLHNGRIDLFNTTFSDDYMPLYLNDGNATFHDASFAMGIAEPTIPFLGWGDAFFDATNSGWLDLLEVNGHVYPQVDQQSWGTTFRQRPLFFRNDHGRLTLAPAVQGSGLAVVSSARGMAFGDLFNDGHIDAVINNLDGPPVLLRNVVANGNHWVELHLVGTGKTPRDPVGATAWLTVDGMTQRADLVRGGSFASSSLVRLHFGLGTASHVESLQVHWPNGPTEKIQLPGVDAIYTVTEGSGVGVLQPGTQTAGSLHIHGDPAPAIRGTGSQQAAGAGP